MKNKFLGVGSLALQQVVIVANLQPLSANAIYGFTLPFLYLCALIGFFIPCVLMVAELATYHPQTGGAYVWAEKAFGKSTGFVTVVMLWISNLLWYPSIFTLIAMNVIYIVEPSWASHKAIVIGMSLLLFWLITGLNCIGVKLSSTFSVVCSVIGIILPIVIIALGGLVWWLGGHPIAISLENTPLIPNLKSFANVGFLIAIATSLFGIEIPAVHAGEVKNPNRNFPRSLFIASIIIVSLLLAVEMSLAIIVPPAELSVVTGVIDAIETFFRTVHQESYIMPILCLMLLGNLGSISAWMLGSTRGMYIACQNNNMIKFFSLSNRNGSPVGVLLIEGIIFTLVSSVFLFLPQITDSFWLLLDVASQISLLYYVILFAATLRLRRTTPYSATHFTIPGGKGFATLSMGLGILTAGLAFFSGFIAPSDLSPHASSMFHNMMAIGLTFAIVFPVAMLFTRLNPTTP